ncbi:hypothetical protein VJ918_07530 [Adlercreutzia sp. R21]|uniref:FeoB-associated Cys-rich membrane protein n=1 Tax=Adlercreutzia wanghongyangiae TaxID=3111451 RepID=A0ABU6IJY6_9ACTN|nr:hypothetical protein [Adlercreutzia sp. R21]MEC4176732.1 hypothetical protein [Adlercreutzia sp. R7]MEC4184656.1 hypothetical protein [Adlercreutzia sp. R21]
MQDIALNAPTVVILLVIAALAVLAVRRMTRRGLCDCGDHCGDEGGCAGCPHCGSATGTAGQAASGEMPPCCQAVQRMAETAAHAAQAKEASNR